MMKLDILIDITHAINTYLLPIKLKYQEKKN